MDWDNFFFGCMQQQVHPAHAYAAQCTPKKGENISKIYDENIPDDSSYIQINWYAAEGSRARGRELANLIITKTLISHLFIYYQ